MDIKFKAFDKNTKEVYDVLLIDFLNKDVLVVIDETRANQKSLPFDECELMQYTGLKGQCNIELYRGYKCALDDDEIGYIEFSNGKFEFIADNIAYDLFDVCDELEVIGNIFE